MVEFLAELLASAVPVRNPRRLLLDVALAAAFFSIAVVLVEGI